MLRVRDKTWKGSVHFEVGMKVAHITGNDHYFPATDCFIHDAALASSCRTVFRVTTSTTIAHFLVKVKCSVWMCGKDKQQCGRMRLGGQTLPEENELSSNNQTEDGSVVVEINVEAEPSRYQPISRHGNRQTLPSGCRLRVAKTGVGVRKSKRLFEALQTEQR